jgi:hypothetical protein
MPMTPCAAKHFLSVVDKKVDATIFRGSRASKIRVLYETCEILLVFYSLEHFGRCNHTALRLRPQKQPTQYSQIHPHFGSILLVVLSRVRVVASGTRRAFQNGKTVPQETLVLDGAEQNRLFVLAFSANG